MDAERIRELVSQLDTADHLAAESAWSTLRPLGSAVVPFLADAFLNFKKWQGRAALLHHTIRHARTSSDAFRIALAGLFDKSKVVRYKACSVLAYSLRKDALSHLREVVDRFDKDTTQHAKAAIDAIRHQNHHYFMDRTHSGSVSWVVNDGEDNV